MSPTLIDTWGDSESCKHCQGIWYERSTLIALHKEVSPSQAFPFATPSPHAGDKRCPDCGQHLQIFEIQGDDICVTVDSCEAHGVWFDHGELEAVLESIMAREDRQRSPLQRHQRPWWASTLAFIFDVFDSKPRR